MYYQMKRKARKGKVCQPDRSGLGVCKNTGTLESSPTMHSGRFGIDISTGFVCFHPARVVPFAAMERFKIAVMPGKK
jgi:hypothetical protein